MKFLSKRVAILSSVAVGATTLLLWAQERPVFRVKVDMVVLSFTVTNNKGEYRNGLKPSDFKITEDGIVQKIATFAEGNRPALQVNDDGTTRPLVAGESGSPGKPGLDPRADAFVGTSNDTANTQTLLVPANGAWDVDFGLLAQPRRHGRRRPIRQQVNDPLLLQIDEDRAVLAPCAPGPVVHAQDAYQPDR